jgi:AraC family transcriptional activator of pobA
VVLLLKPTMKHFDSLSDLHREIRLPRPEHPLFSIFRFDQARPVADYEFTTDFYMVVFKKSAHEAFFYGRTNYDSDNGSICFIHPRQVIKIKGQDFSKGGFCIIINEDFLIRHSLHSKIQEYNFFYYDPHEALHVSPREERVFWDVYHKIEIEYNNNQDEFTQDIILARMSSIFQYAQRFYKRQFITRKKLSEKTLLAFEDLVRAYIKSEHLLPSIKLVARQLNSSPKYLSDILKFETGKTAIEVIENFINC